jgi:hypothetical protein
VRRFSNREKGDTSLRQKSAALRAALFYSIFLGKANKILKIAQKFNACPFKELE